MNNDFNRSLLNLKLKLWITAAKEAIGVMYILQLTNRWQNEEIM